MTFVALRKGKSSSAFPEILKDVGLPIPPVASAIRRTGQPKTGFAVSINGWIWVSTEALTNALN